MHAGVFRFSSPFDEKCKKIVYDFCLFAIEIKMAYWYYI